MQSLKSSPRAHTPKTAPFLHSCLIGAVAEHCCTIKASPTFLAHNCSSNRNKMSSATNPATSEVPAAAEVAKDPNVAAVAAPIVNDETTSATEPVSSSSAASGSVDDEEEETPDEEENLFMDLEKKEEQQSAVTGEPSAVESAPLLLQATLNEDQVKDEDKNKESVEEKKDEMTSPVRQRVSV